MEVLVKQGLNMRFNQGPHTGASVAAASRSCILLLQVLLLVNTTAPQNLTNYSVNLQNKSWSNEVHKFMFSDKITATSLYIGYANNPFGPSKKLKQKETQKATSPAPAAAHQIPSGDLSGSDLLNSIDVLDPIAQSGIKHGADDEVRAKRGVIHLYNMVSCATGCNPLSYKGYGCYCGFLGSGYAVDGIDRCCKMHDWCYDTSNCPMFLEYFVPYLWKCYRRRPLCAIDHGDWGGSGSCAQRLCECDRALSECLRRYPCPRERAVCTSSPWRLLQNAFMIF